MAIKERLLKQLNIVRDGLNAMPPFHSRDLNTMRKALVQARDLCFQGLSEKSFAEYKDTYDGLLLAINQLAADASDQGEIVSLCSELLQYTITQTQKETAFKKEIFFLPYKASMWDSLESVWKAADEDKEHCIVYVMPIPYADLTSEHTVAEWHCEKDLFPKDVPTVDWKNFDLQEIHPDVIFIHNPYDEYNRVTSVERRFYSGILKDQTDKLVYIPYFVLAEPELDGKSEEEIEKIEANIERFVMQPAVLYSHQVIVQSEAMRRVYIDILTRQTGQTDRAFWEKRILGLGSPKFDKVVATQKEDLDIPGEWLRIIKKSDGSWKKIIFYNTGLTAFLKYEEKYLAKIRQVLQICKENKDKITLLWRPHPLMKATIQSLRPELAEEYEEIIKQYKEEAWGIYDDSADIDRAIVLSDAYYGDRSSVVQLYQKTSKPIMIQGMSVVEEAGDEASIPLRFYDAAFYGGYMYFSAANFNGLFRVKVGEENAEFLGHFDCVSLSQKEIHRICILEGDTLYFIPLHSKGIHVYHIPTGRFSFVPIVDNNSREVTCSNAYLYGNKIFLLPFTYEDEFYCYDLGNGCVERLEQLTKKVNVKQMNQNEDWIDFQGSILVGNKLYVVIFDTNILLTIELQTCQLEQIVLPIKAKLQTINFIDGVFWFTMDEHKILQWNEITKEVKTISIPNMTGKETFGHPYLRVLKSGKVFLVAPGRTDNCWIYNKVADRWKNLFNSESSAFQRSIEERYVLFGGYRAYENGDVLLFPKAGNRMVLFSTDKHKISSKAIKTGTDFQKSYWEIIGSSVMYFMETQKVIDEKQMAFANFLSVMQGDIFSGKKLYMPSESAKSMMVGRRIYDQETVERLFEKSVM